MLKSQRVGLVAMVFSVVVAIILLFSAQTACQYACEVDWFMYTLLRGGFYLDYQGHPEITLTSCLAVCLIVFALGLLALLKVFAPSPRPTPE